MLPSAAASISWSSSMTSRVVACKVTSFCRVKVSPLVRSVRLWVVAPEKPKSLTTVEDESSPKVRLLTSSSTLWVPEARFPIFLETKTSSATIVEPEMTILPALAAVPPEMSKVLVSARSNCLSLCSFKIPPPETKSAPCLEVTGGSASVSSLYLPLSSTIAVYSLPLLRKSCKVSTPMTKVPDELGSELAVTLIVPSSPVPFSARATRLAPSATVSLPPETVRVPESWMLAPLSKVTAVPMAWLEASLPWPMTQVPLLPTKTLPCTVPVLPKKVSETVLEPEMTLKDPLPMVKSSV